MPSARNCTAPDCARPVRARGLCASHYEARRRNVELGPTRAPRGTVRVEARLTDDEAASAKARADGDGVTLSEWIRRAVTERLLLGR